MKYGQQPIAGFVELALALTLWWSPGISVQLSPAL
jgi:hypothetical protein